MNWRNLYSGFDKILSAPGYFLVATTSASALIGILYLQNPFEGFINYLPVVAALCYFLGRFLFCAYYRITIGTNEILGYAFVASTGVAIVGQLTLGIDAFDKANRSSWDFTYSMWVFNVIYFFAGASACRARYFKSNIIGVLLALAVLVPLLKATQGELLVNYYNLKQSTGMESLSHLNLSEWCVFLFFGAFAFSKPMLRPVIIIVAFYCLFSLQGRSSTLFAISTLIVFSYLMDGKRILISVAVVAVLAGLVFVFSPIQEMLLDTSEKGLDRMLMSAEDGDSSGEARQYLFSDSISHLPQSILFGDPAFIAEKWQWMGSYIHNLLSVWQFFGLLPFILIVVILYRSLRIMWRTIKTRKPSVMEEIASMMLIYTVISVIASKSVVFYWLWFTAGYWMLRYSEQTHAQGKKGKRRKRSRSRSKRRKAPSGAGMKIRF